MATYLQVVRGYNAIETGVIFTAATVGILVSSLAAERLAKKHPQRSLIVAGFIVTLCGIALLLAMVVGSPSAWAFAPGLLLIGLGVGVMLTPSVNVVQSSFPDAQQGEISGLSRSVSNLGSSLGTAVAGTILVAELVDLVVRPRDDRAGRRRGHRTGRRTAPPLEPGSGCCRLRQLTDVTLARTCRRRWSGRSIRSCTRSTRRCGWVRWPAASALT